MSKFHQQKTDTLMETFPAYIDPPYCSNCGCDFPHKVWYEPFPEVELLSYPFVMDYFCICEDCYNSLPVDSMLKPELYKKFRFGQVIPLCRT